MCYGPKDSCYPSINYIANALGTCTRTINRYLKELVELGLILKRRRGSISNIYTLLQKKAGQAIEKVQEIIKSAKKAYKSNYKPYPNKKESVFNNFEQRTYDYDNLEEKLLGWSTKK
jgi:DNA-binding GntR family transcriptional regulator